VDLISCHLKILADLKLGAKELAEILATGQNIWKNIVNTLSEKTRQEFEFSFLKACIKRLAYKCLQGGRIDTAEKIHQTLNQEEKASGKSLEALSSELAKNPLLQEFMCLNQEIMRRYKRQYVLEVLAPMDTQPLTLLPKKSELGWSTENSFS
jgi:hypothetical protein